MSTPSTAPECPVCNDRGYFEDGLCFCPAAFRYTDAIAEHNDKFTKALLSPGGFEDDCAGEES
jgi:hypothetical protein